VEGLSKVPLTPEDRRLYQRIEGATIAERVAKILKSPSWATLSPARQKAVLEAAMTIARRKAEDDTIRVMTVPEARRRIRQGASSTPPQAPRPGPRPRLQSRAEQHLSAGYHGRIRRNRTSRTKKASAPK
jgi:hypothetical protein